MRASSLWRWRELNPRPIRRNPRLLRVQFAKRCFQLRHSREQVADEHSQLGVAQRLMTNYWCQWLSKRRQTSHAKAT